VARLLRSRRDSDLRAGTGASRGSFRTPAATRSRWSIRLLIHGRRCRCLRDAGSRELPPTGPWMASSLEVGLLLSREAAAGRGAGLPPRPPGLLLAQNSSPALTCIIGARLAWIALMISSVLIPRRYTLVVDTSRPRGSESGWGTVGPQTTSRRPDRPGRRQARCGRSWRRVFLEVCEAGPLVSGSRPLKRPARRAY
jgi:hypothetical protein